MSPPAPPFAFTPTTRSRCAAEHGRPGSLPRDRIAVLRMPGRIWAIAAIHAEAKALADLHRKLAVRLRRDDRIVYLGNLLGRGAAVMATMNELLAFRHAVIARPGGGACDVAYVRGAQEEMWQRLLQLQFATAPTDVLRWLVSRGLGPTIAAYGGQIEDGLAATRDGSLAIARWTNSLRTAQASHPGHAALFAALRPAAAASDRSAVFVHTGLDPALPLDRQGDVLWWGGGFTRLAAPFDGHGAVVRGYDAAHAGLTVSDFTIGIDGGCGFGGPLLAACIGQGGHLIDSLEGY